MVSNGRRLVAVLGLCLAMACAKGAETLEMVPATDTLRRASAFSPLYEAVAVGKVGGGEETEAFGRSHVGDAQFEHALRLALLNHEFLAGDDTVPAYRLDAFLVELQQEGSSVTGSLKSAVRYRLVRLDGDAVVFDAIGEGVGAARINEAPLAATRRRLAIERAMRDNIANLLSRLRRVG